MQNERIQLQKAKYGMIPQIMSVTSKSREIKSRLMQLPGAGIGGEAGMGIFWGG